MKLLVVNLSWFDGNYDKKAKTSASGFAYSKENPYVHECFNFKNKNGYYYAYVPGMSSLNIQRIGANRSEDSISNVFVIFISKDEKSNARKIIGYYENATVLKKSHKGPNILNGQNIYYLISSQKAKVFPVEKRPVIDGISSFKGSRGLFGQKAVWYPDLSNTNVVHIVSKMLVDIGKIKHFFGYENLEEYNEILSSEIEKSYNDDSSNRKERLKKAPKIPAKTQMTTSQYRRNPDVIAEVLHRANGICEHCHQPAPFISKSKGTPYLEVHHIIQLSKQGEDTVENTIAVCPNCHRKLHFGE
jgi:HNH nuclease